MHEIFESLLNNMGMNKLMPLKAIWLDQKEAVIVETPEGELKKTVRLEKGMQIRVCHSTILDIREDAPSNYTISECMGDLYSTQLEMHLIGNDGSEYKLILK